MSETENNKTNESAENKAAETETTAVAENTIADTKAKPKKKSQSVKRELIDDEDRYYDYEGKGADSVFNLDD